MISVSRLLSAGMKLPEWHADMITMRCRMPDRSSMAARRCGVRLLSEKPGKSTASKPRVPCVVMNRTRMSLSVLMLLPTPSSTRERLLALASGNCSRVSR